MPTLNWIGKDKVTNHHLEVPFRTLTHSYGFTPESGQSPTKTDSGNLIIHGDNLEALKALLPRYEGQVDFIYIDPPYNTGEEKWAYNDNVNDPQIRKWLGEIVGKQGEDLTRHDKWLCMMYPRMCLLQKLLSSTGTICISINFVHEHAHLRMLCDEIFGQNNFIGELTWESTTQPINSGSARFNLQQKVEPILFYAQRQNPTSTLRIRRGRQRIVLSAPRKVRSLQVRNHRKIQLRRNTRVQRCSSAFWDKDLERGSDGR